MTAHTGLLSHLVGPRLERREIALWSAATFVVLAVHAGTGWLIGQPRPPVAAEDAAPAAIMIDLAPATIEPAAVAADMADMVDSDFVAPTEEPVETAEPVAETETVTDAVDTPEVAEVVPDRAEQTEPEKVDTAETAEIQPEEPPAEAVDEETAAEIPPDETIAEVREVIPDIVEAPLPEVAMAIPEPAPVVEPEPEETPKPVEKPKPVKKAAEPPKPAKAPPKKKVQPPPQLAKTKSAPSAPKAATAAGSQGARGSRVSPAAWERSVTRHIMRRQRVAGGRGKVSIIFVVNAGGSVVSVSVAGTSGNPKLDAAAVSLVRRSSPVPAPPADLPKSRRTIRVPISFE